MIQDKELDNYGKSLPDKKNMVKASMIKTSAVKESVIKTSIRQVFIAILLVFVVSVLASSMSNIVLAEDAEGTPTVIPASVTTNDPAATNTNNPPSQHLSIDRTPSEHETSTPTSSPGSTPQRTTSPSNIPRSITSPGSKQRTQQRSQQSQSETIGFRWEAAYRSALVGQQLGNMLFCSGQQETRDCFGGWGRAIDKMFKGTFGMLAYPEEAMCKKYTDKVGNEGIAMMLDEAGNPKFVAHVEAERSQAITYPAEVNASEKLRSTGTITNTTKITTEYLYKITFAVKAPEDDDIKFNVELQGMGPPRRLFPQMKELGKGREYAERGQNARVKYSPNYYTKICLVFEAKYIDWPNPICNEIITYTGGPTAGIAGVGAGLIGGTGAGTSASDDW